MTPSEGSPEALPEGATSSLTWANLGLEHRPEFSQRRQQKPRLTGAPGASALLHVQSWD